MYFSLENLDIKMTLDKKWNYILKRDIIPFSKMFRVALIAPR